MKKTLFALFALCMLMATKAMAYEWTDGNGVKWTFYQQKFTIDGTEQQLWTITGVSGYGESIVFPEKVIKTDRVRENGQYVDKTEEVTIEAIGNFSSDNCVFGSKTAVTAVTIPANIKYIGYNALNFYAGTVTMKSSTPPVLGIFDNLWSSRPNFGAGVTILVPHSNVAIYRESDIWSNYSVRIISQTVKTDYKVSVSAQSIGSGIHTAIGEDNLINVMSLKVTGTINSYDIMIIRNKMHNLHHLDLSDATVVANNYEYYKTYFTTDNAIGDYAFYELQKLMSVKLPKTIKSIGKCAFMYCYGLRTVEFQDGLETIGETAFRYCNSLQYVATKKGLQTIESSAFYGLPSLKYVDIAECEIIGYEAFRGCRMTTLTIGTCKTIGQDAFRGCSMTTITIGACNTINNYAFYGCRSLVSVSLPEGLQTIGGSAFAYCSSLPGITIPKGVTSIGGSAFYACDKLAAIAYPNTLKTIGDEAFGNCTSLTTISLPTSLTSIGSSAFIGCSSLVELHIPSSIRTIGETAFKNCHVLKDIYTYTVEPTTINQYTFSCWTIATLHIPYFAKNNYYWETQWSQFAYLTEFGQEYKYDYFYINNDFTFSNETGLVQGVPDADLNPGSGLIVTTTNDALKLDELHIRSNATTAASVLANNNLSVQKLYFDIAVTKNKWYFLTFPFRVKLANVQSPGDFVFRYYDGATRAQNGKGGWKNVETAYLNPGQGYIFQTNADGTLTLEVEKADMDFSGAGKQDALATYASSSTANASWNFLGNPHTSYFDINQTGYTAPITVWNGSAYQAIRPGDDTYYLKPFEAFFVQKPEGTAAVSFPATGRYTYQQTQSLAASARSEAPANTGRYLVNLTIATSDNAAVDKTRVVYNEQKTTGYEIDCDAAKFFSDGVAAQLYTLDHEGTQYAINERPLGEVAVGYVAAEKGLMTISAERMERPVLLRDNVMGITHDLSQGGYTFQTNAGTNESRFTLTFATTGISDAERLNDKVEMTNDKLVYDLQGRQVSNGQLKKGGYIVKDGKKTKKIIMK